MTEGRADALVDQRYSGPPAPGQVWSRRARDSDRMYASWDIPAPAGTPVHAALDGEVIYSGARPGYGETVILLHREPPTTEAAGEGPLTTAYCHLAERRALHGEQVTGGHVIGTVGNTREGPGGARGNLRGPVLPHLHFSVQRVQGDSSRARYEDDDGSFAGSRQVPDPPTDALAGDRQAWFNQQYEEDWTRQVKPDDWAEELGIADATEDLGGSPRRRYPRRHGGARDSVVDIEFVDAEDQPAAGVLYRLTLSDGELREGESDESGAVQIEEVQPGTCQLELVQRPPESWELISEPASTGDTPAGDASADGEAADAPASAAPRTTRPIPTDRRMRIRVRPPYPIFPDQAEETHSDSRGTFHVFPTPTRNVNETNRPIPPRFIIRDRSQLQEFPGAGGSGMLHPVVHEPLQRMLDAMRAEGERVDDASLKNVSVLSPWRDPVREGRVYLRVLSSHLRFHRDCHQGGAGCVASRHNDRYARPARHCRPGFQNRARAGFPASLQEEARGELGRSGSPAHRAFEAHLAAAPGWNRAFAHYLIRQVSGVKAPAGGSPHHSGLVVDLDWPYWDTTLRTPGTRDVDTDSGRNGEGRRSGVGVWINAHARAFGFSSYDEGQEIWHLEWLEWPGTSADPGSEPSAGGE